jgi:hypothetical protein
MKTSEPMYILVYGVGSGEGFRNCFEQYVSLLVNEWILFGVAPKTFI